MWGSPILYSGLASVTFFSSPPSLPFWFELPGKISPEVSLALKKKFEKHWFRKLRGYVILVFLFLNIFKTHENWHLPIIKLILPGHSKMKCWYEFEWWGWCVSCGVSTGSQWGVCRTCTLCPGVRGLGEPGLLSEPGASGSELPPSTASVLVFTEFS